MISFNKEFEASVYISDSIYPLLGAATITQVIGAIIPHSRYIESEIYTDASSSYLKEFTSVDYIFYRS